MKSLFRAAVISAAATGLLGLWTVPASAVTQSCTAGNHVVSVTNAGLFSCGTQPSYAGTEPIVRTFFTGNDAMAYTLSFDTGGDSPEGTGLVNFSGFTNKQIPGTWSLGANPGIASILVGIKKGELYALFELVGTSGSWEIKSGGGPTKTVNNEYSHLDIWYKLGGGTTTEIPLPASALLLFSGLAGLGYLGARRRAA